MQCRSLYSWLVFFRSSNLELFLFLTIPWHITACVSVVLLFYWFKSKWKKKTFKEKSKNKIVEFVQKPFQVGQIKCNNRGKGSRIDRPVGRRIISAQHLMSNHFSNLEEIGITRLRYPAAHAVLTCQYPDSFPQISIPTKFILIKEFYSPEDYKTYTEGGLAYSGWVESCSCINDSIIL